MPLGPFKTTSAREIAAALVTLPWLVWALARVLGADLTHPAVALMAFTPWAAATSAVPLAVAILLRAWRVAALAAVTVAVFAVLMSGRELPGPRPEVLGSRLNVMTANMLMSRGDARQVTGLVAKHSVDILALEELTPKTVKSLRRTGLENHLPYFLDDSRTGTTGTGIWSSRPLARTGRQWNSNRAQAPEGAIKELNLRVRAVHPFPPISRRAVRDWRDDIRTMPSAGDDSGNELKILAGDFNATLDNRELRRLIDRGYTDAADAAGVGLVWTWPTTGRLKLTIDHILVDDRIRVERVDVEEIAGSDHRAVIAALRLPHTPG